MVHSEFNLIFNLIFMDLFGFKFVCMWMMLLFLSFMHACTCPSLYLCKQLDLLGWKMVQRRWSSFFKQWWDILSRSVTYNCAQNPARVPKRAEATTATTSRSHGDVRGALVRVYFHLAYNLSMFERSEDFLISRFL